MSQETTCAGVSFLIKRDSNIGDSCENFEIFKNIYFYKTPPIAASEIMHVERFEYSVWRKTKSDQYEQHVSEEVGKINFQKPEKNFALSAGPLHILSHWGGHKFFKKGQLQGRLKQLSLEKDPGNNTR